MHILSLPCTRVPFTYDANVQIAQESPFREPTCASIITLYNQSALRIFTIIFHDVFQRPHLHPLRVSLVYQKSVDFLGRQKVRIGSVIAETGDLKF